MSRTSTSTISYDINDNMEHDMKPGIYGQRYLSSDYEADRKQVEYIRDIILEESERFCNKKIEELTNIVVSEGRQHMIIMSHI